MARTEWFKVTKNSNDGKDSLYEDLSGKMDEFTRIVMADIAQRNLELIMAKKDETQNSDQKEQSAPLAGGGTPDRQSAWVTRTDEMPRYSDCVVNLNAEDSNIADSDDRVARMREIIRLQDNARMANDAIIPVREDYVTHDEAQKIVSQMMWEKEQEEKKQKRQFVPGPTDVTVEEAPMERRRKKRKGRRV